MSAFHTTPNQIVQLDDAGQLETEVAQHLTEAGCDIGENERRAWRNSLPTLARHLCELGFGDLDALVEYQLPRSSRRIDVVLAGAAPGSGRPAYLVVELKQWSWANWYDGSESLLNVPGMHERQLHPAIQVQAYCSYLVDFVSWLPEWPDAVHGMAYLHNATRDRIPELLARERPYQSMVYTRDRKVEFAGYLKRRFATARSGHAAHRLLTSPIRASRQLLTLTAEEIGSRSHFTLLDEQREAYELVRRAVRWADEGRRKRLVVISGGPGSGKSAIALNLLADLAREGRQVAHATGSRAFTRSLKQYARRSRDPYQRTVPVFNYFFDFMRERPDRIDVLICDEAHRIRERSYRGGVTGSRSQVDELIDAAKVPVFLLDADQVVRPNEVGSVELIQEAAERRDLDVDPVILGAQFRCGGSPRYERWLLRLLGLVPGGPYPWPGDENFRLELVSSPEEMEARLRQRQDANETARISAGFCWEWTHEPRDGRLVPDVTIGRWSRPWNLDDGYSVRGVPKGSYWATDPRGFDQVGCIYTAQGFEYDWSGVIVGGDLVVNNGRLITRPERSHDPAIVDKRARNVDKLIRNTYKVLLTRGLRGTLVYSVDKDTQEFLSRLIPPVRRLRIREAEGVQRLAPSRAVPQRPGDVVRQEADGASVPGKTQSTDGGP
ncbi:DUF2075 domain-containing protein [Micromonospora sp. NPDC049559]|uniref:DUF2075 domain-containing protein n=1 Tax=Micromonospora sp. NPDC049559 TaxID=3155923 RepID=UPI003414C751